MYPVTLGDTLHVMGPFAIGLDYTVRLKLRLRDAVDGALLEEAAEKTRRRYPYFSVRLRKDKANYYYEDNPAPVAVLHTDKRVSLNTEETNFHVWCVCYHADWLDLDFYHGIADGTGMYTLLATLLYYYCERRYGVTDHAGVRTLDDPIEPEETADPMERLPRLDLSGMQRTAREQVFCLTTDGGLTPSETQIRDIEIPESAFISFSSANDASPGTMISILLARAIDALYPERQKPLTGRYVVNARPMLHGEKSHHNCIGGVMFSYTDRVKAMPFDRQCTAHRGATFLQSDEDRVRGSLSVSTSLYRQIAQGLPTSDAKKEAFGQMMRGGAAYTSFIVSYVGQWRLQSLSPYILEFWTHVPAANPMLVEIAAINGKIFLSVHQTFREELVLQSFLRQLEANGIPYTLRQPAEPDNARFPEPELA